MSYIYRAWPYYLKIERYKLINETEYYFFIQNESRVKPFRLSKEWGNTFRNLKEAKNYINKHINEEILILRKKKNRIKIQI